MRKKVNTLVFGTECDPILDILIGIKEGKLLVEIIGIVTSDNSIMIKHLAGEFGVDIISEINVKFSGFLENSFIKESKEFYKQIIIPDQVDFLLLCGWRYPLPREYSIMNILKCSKPNLEEELVVTPYYIYNTHNTSDGEKSLEKWKKYCIG